MFDQVAFAHERGTLLHESMADHGLHRRQPELMQDVWVECQESSVEPLFANKTGMLLPAHAVHFTPLHHILLDARSFGRKIQLT
jgi:hypothetical protein